MRLCAMLVQDGLPLSMNELSAKRNSFVGALEWVSKRWTGSIKQLDLAWNLISYAVSLEEVLFHLNISPGALNCLEVINISHNVRKQDFAVGEHVNSLFRRLNEACKQKVSKLLRLHVDISPFGFVSPPPLTGKFHSLKSVTFGGGRMGELDRCLQACQYLEELAIFGTLFHLAFVPDLILVRLPKLRAVQLRNVQCGGHVDVRAGCEVAVYKKAYNRADLPLVSTGLQFITTLTIDLSFFVSVAQDQWRDIGCSLARLRRLYVRGNRVNMALPHMPELQHVTAVSSREVLLNLCSATSLGSTLHSLEFVGQSVKVQGLAELELALRDRQNLPQLRVYQHHANNNSMSEGAAKTLYVCTLGAGEAIPDMTAMTASLWKTLKDSLVPAWL